MDLMPNDIINIIINKLDKVSKWSFIQICKKFKKYGYSKFNCELADYACKNNYFNLLKYANLKKFYGFKTAFYGYLNLLKYGYANNLINKTSFITNYAIIGSDIETIEWSIKTFNFNNSSHRSLILINDITRKNKIILYLKEKNCPNIDTWLRTLH